MLDWRTWILGAWTALVLVTGIAGAWDASRDTGSAAAVGSSLASVSPADSRVTDGSEPDDPAVVSPPSVVEAPAVGLAAPLVPVGKTSDGALAVPAFGTAGWYRHSPVPGSPGSAVLAGHVDSTTGPDVFFALGALEPGDDVLIRHEDGSVSTFVVDRLEVTDKERLPVARIFGPSEGANLRLITCGGAFDRQTGTYRSNVIAYAQLVARTPGAGQPTSS